MPLNPEDRVIIAKSHLEKAIFSLGEANKIWDITPQSASRLCYDCVYHCAAALFVAEKIEIPKSHEGVNRVMHECFVRGENLIPKEIAPYLGKLETVRNNVSYSTFVINIVPEDAREYIQMAEKFVQVMQPLIQTRISAIEQDKENKLEREIFDLKLKEGPMKIFTEPKDFVEYKGRILHVDKESGYLVQLTGKISLIVHQIDKLERVPRKGEKISILYSGGKAIVR